MYWKEDRSVKSAFNSLTQGENIVVQGREYPRHACQCAWDASFGPRIRRSTALFPSNRSLTGVLYVLRTWDVHTAATGDSGQEVSPYSDMESKFDGGYAWVCCEIIRFEIFWVYGMNSYICQGRGGCDVGFIGWCIMVWCVEHDRKWCADAVMEAQM